MRLHHLHLNVRDRAASEQFYATWFGFTLDRRTAALSFLLDSHDLLLVLLDDPAPAPLPDWFHFGFPQEDAGAVRALHDRMVQAGLSLRRPLVDQPDITAFRVNDPDGHPIEIYWLPLGHRTISATQAA